MIKKLTFVLTFFGFFVFWPQPSFASVSYRDAYGPGPNIYIYNDDYLIHIGHEGDTITGKVWVNESWTEEETIFTDVNDDFDLSDDNFRVTELANGSLVIIDDDQLVTYSSFYGFQHEDLTAYDGVEFGKNKLVLIDCDDTVNATTWSEAAGLGTPTELGGALCGEDLAWFALNKNVLIDYYSGNAYDTGNSYTILDSIDLSHIGYNDDLDAQGIIPTVLNKKNGDIVFGFTPGDDSSDADFEYLFGYSHENATWQPIVSPVDAGAASGGIYQTENAKHFFAIGSSADQTQYVIYKWTPADGWQLEKTYEFDEAAQLIMPDDTKKSSALYWAFWLNSSDQLQVYRWTEDEQYEQLTQRDLECNQSCSFGLEVSRKGKVFFSWKNNPTLSAAAWKPGADTWDDVVLVESAGGSIADTHITDKGQWIVQYSSGEESLLKRWTPDNGWGSAYTLTAKGIYFSGDKLYLVYLDKVTHVLTLDQWKWSTSSSELITTIEEISSFEEEVSFVYNANIFLYYLTQDEERVMDAVSL